MGRDNTYFYVSYCKHRALLHSRDYGTKNTALIEAPAMTLEKLLDKGIRLKRSQKYCQKMNKSPRIKNYISSYMSHVFSSEDWN